MKTRKQIQHLFEYIILSSLIFFFSALPLVLVYWLSSLLGYFIYFFIPIRKTTAYYNLKRVFPDKSKREIYSIVRRIYKNFALFICESIIMHKVRKNINKITEIHNIECLEKAHKQGKGVILYTAHIGNWHIMGQSLVEQGFPINNIVKKQRNERVFAKEVSAMENVGMKVTILQKTPKNILKALKEGDVVEFLSDQDAGPDGVFVDFFRKKASTPKGPALFALKTGAPIIFALDIREKNNNHSIYLEEIDCKKSDDLEKDIKNLTELMVKRLESYILKYPDQYFWLHKRWLSRP